MFIAPKCNELANRCNELACYLQHVCTIWNVCFLKLGVFLRRNLKKQTYKHDISDAFLPAYSTTDSFGFPGCSGHFCVHSGLLA